MALIQVNMMSKSLMRTVTFNVILPVDKFGSVEIPEREEKPYKTLYLLHGIFGNYTDWVTGTCVQRYADEKKSGGGYAVRGKYVLRGPAGHA